MSSEAETLQKKLAELLSWERRKRHEQILATLFCYALLAALLILPFHGFLETVISRWFIPILFFGLMAPFFLGRGRWRLVDSARALARVDKTLRLDERALTAWELLERNETRAAALMVLKQAGEKLTNLDPKALFRRSWSWQAYCALPLLLLWLGLYGLTSVFDSTAVCSFLLRRPSRRSCESFLENSRRKRRTRVYMRASEWVESWSR